MYKNEDSIGWNLIGTTSIETSIYSLIKILVKLLSISSTGSCRRKFRPMKLADTAQGSYRWLFGDGDSSGIANPNHTYHTDSTYQVILDLYQVSSLAQVKQCIDHSLSLYNNERPHFSIRLLTPENVHANNLKVENLWKKPRKVITIPHPASLEERALDAGGITFCTPIQSFKKCNTVN
jgi:hypothetical protein